MDNQPKFQQMHALEVLNENAHKPVIFAGTDAGLFTSYDEGKNWAYALEKSNLETSEEAPSIAVTALKASHSVDGTVTLFAGTLGGIYRSTDRGKNWQAVVFGKPAPVITAFAISRAKFIHAATLADGVFTSADNGLHWERWNFGLLDWRVYSIASSSNADGACVLFAGTESGIYASKNNGRTWRETSFPDASGAVLALTAAPDGKTLFAGTENGVVYCSQDCGLSWQSVYEDDDDAEIAAMISDRTAQGEIIAAAACGSQLLRTKGSGHPWQVWGAAGAASAETAITALSAPQGLGKGATLWAARDDCSVFHFVIP